MYSAHSESSVLESTSSVFHAEGRENRDSIESHQAYLKCMANTRIGPALKVYVSASDVVQSTFASACRRMVVPGAQNVRNPKNWLTGILFNKIREAARKYGPGISRAPSADPVLHLFDDLPPSDTSDHFEKSVDDSDAFAWAMAKLPENQRQVVELHLLHQLEMAEIAAVLGVTEACARKRYQRAMEFLQDRIDPREYR